MTFQPVEMLFEFQERGRRLKILQISRVSYNEALESRIASLDGSVCPRLFTICLNPIAWRISASQGYKLFKPISVKLTDLPCIDDLKTFASLESKLKRVTESTRSAMEDFGLLWNPQKVCCHSCTEEGTYPCP